MASDSKSQTEATPRKARGRAQTPRKNVTIDEPPRSTTKSKKSTSAASKSPKTPKTPKATSAKSKSPARGRSRSPARSVKKPSASSTPKRAPSRSRKASSPKQAATKTPATPSTSSNAKSASNSVVKSVAGDQPESRVTRKRAARNTADSVGSAEKRKKLSEPGDVSISGDSDGSGRSWWSCSVM